jgi:hypothetical protein
MFVRQLAGLAAALTLIASNASAENLRCSANAVLNGSNQRELRIDIVLPEANDYNKELAIVDANTGTTSLLAVNELLGWHQRKALGSIEIAIKNAESSDFSAPSRYPFLLTTQPAENTLGVNGLILGEGKYGSLPSLVVIDFRAGKKTIGLASSWHRGSVLTVYEGTCE